MLHVREVYHLLLPLFLLHPPPEFQHQIQEGIHRLPAGLMLAQGQGQGSAKELVCQALYGVLHFPPHLLAQFPLARRYTVILLRRQTAKRKGTQLPLKVLPGFTSRQPLQLFQFLIHQFPVHIRAIWHLAQGLHPAQLLHAACRHPLQVSCQILPPGAFLQFLHCLPGIILPALFQPLVRPGKAGGIPGQGQDIPLQHTLPASGAEVLHTIAEGLSALLEGILQKLPQHFLFHELHFPLVCNPESRIQPHLMEMVPQQEQAETVYGGNLGIVQQGSLSLDVLRIRPFLQLCRDPRPNALPHLCRSSIGESHNQQAVNIHRVGLVTDHLYDTLHQNCRLAAACRRRYQDVAVPGVNHFLLLFRK